MATLTIRNLPDDVRDRLRVRAAQNGRSMEAEARLALVQAYTAGGPTEPLSADQRATRARALIRAHLRPGVSLVDELITDRRSAAARGE